MKKNISENIRDIREKKGLTQEDLAEHLKISQQAYSLIEKKPERTTLMHLMKIANILEVNLSTLIMEDSSGTQNINEPKNCNIGFHQSLSSS